MKPLILHTVLLSGAALEVTTLAKQNWCLQHRLKTERTNDQHKCTAQAIRGHSERFFGTWVPLDQRLAWRWGHEER